jgi:hypothetical protein
VSAGMRDSLLEGQFFKDAAKRTSAQNIQTSSLIGACKTAISIACPRSEPI